MKLEKKMIHMSYEKGKAVSQITIDDDFNVPDYKPDFVKIIHDKGEVRIEEVKISGGHILIRGTLNFEILYRSDQKEKRAAHLMGNVPFQETLVMDGIEDFDPVEIKTELEDLSIGIINSRKLSIRAILVIYAKVNAIKDEEVLCGMEDEKNIQIQKKPHEFSELELARKDTLRIKQEIPIPSNKPNIEEIIWKSVQPRAMETRISDGVIHITGELLLGVIYDEEGEEERLQWLEQVVPVKGTIDCKDIDDEMICRVEITMAQADLETKPDFEAEERMLALDVVLDLDISVWREERMEIIEDLYSVDRKLLPEYAESQTEKLLQRNNAKTRVNDSVALDNAAQNIMQICTAEGSARLEQTEVVPEGIKISGTLELQIPYISQEDAAPLGRLNGVVPFEQLIEIPGTEKLGRYDVGIGIDQLSVTMADENRLEVRAVLDIDLVAFGKENFPKITEVKEEKRDMEELKKIPGITGYIVKDGDSLWNIAKENYSTTEEIMRTNGLSNPEIREGDKLLIVKMVFPETGTGKSHDIMR